MGCLLVIFSVMEDFRHVSRLLAARNKAKKKKPMVELMAGYARMLECISNPAPYGVAPAVPVGVPAPAVAVVVPAPAVDVVVPAPAVAVVVPAPAVAGVVPAPAVAVVVPAPLVPVVVPAPSVPVVVPAPSVPVVLQENVIDPVDLLEAGPSSALDTVASEVVVMSDLVDTYLTDSIRPSTLRQYRCYWGKFRTFCHRYGWSSLPASAEHVAQFIVTLAEQSGTKSSARNAKAAINFYHGSNLPMVPSPTESFVVKKMIQTAIKKFAKPAKKSTPVSSKELIYFGILLTRQLGGEVKELRMAAMFLLQFGLMARWGDVQQLKVGQVMVLASGDLEVHVASAKNYESYAAKSSFLPSNPGGSVDVVAIVRSYLVAMGGQPGDVLFTNFTRAKGGGVRFLNTPLSGSNVVTLLREGLYMSGFIADHVTLHLVKTGAVSEARNNSCPRNLLCRHARWLAKNMVDYYHSQSLYVKLKACKYLNLFLPA